MTITVAINGFGRIGRLVMRAIAERTDHNLKIVAINDLGSAEDNAHLFKYDSVHGRFPGSVEAASDSITIDGHKIKIFAKANPEELPWKDLGIDIVLECSGHFTSKESASKHLTAGAKKVLISAPADNVDLTVVYGVNHDQIKPDHTVISNASCTTNCLAPVASELHKALGIVHGYMTTIHAYTGDQRLVDTLHKDLRRARAAAVSLIPSSTGAARAVGLVLPELKGKLDGTAIRVPTPNVSMVDFKFVSKKSTTPDEINAIMTKASQENLKGVLEINNAPCVSIDFNHDPASSTFDVTQTQVVDGTFCRVLSWYDNEWGFSNRMIDTCQVMGNDY